MVVVVGGVFPSAFFVDTGMSLLSQKWGPIKGVCSRKAASVTVVGA